MPSPSRTRRRISLESLEERSNPSFTVTLTGAAVAFTSANDSAALYLSRDPAGFLAHNLPADEGYASETDLNATQPGVQARRVNNISRLTVTNPGPGTYVSLTDINRPATIRADVINVGLGAFPNADATVTDRRLTVTSPGFRYNLADATTVQVFGGAGANRFDGSAFTRGGVTFEGFGGNDTLVGGPGTDYLVAGPGADVLTGNGGDDTLVGNEDNDTLSGGPGADFLEGGAGADVSDGGAGLDRLTEEVTTDATVTDAVITVDGTAVTGHNFEAVVLNASDAANRLDAGAFTLGEVYLYGNGGNDTLIGTGSDDVLSGGEGNDLLDGGAGNDGVGGDAGNDTLLGGDGNDYVTAATGDDTYDAGAGTDTVYDTLGEGTAYDAVVGDATVSISREGAPAVAMPHGAETFYLDGGPGDDRIDFGGYTRHGQYATGNGGNDTLIGTGHTDQLFGGDGDDSLDGGDADDQLYGEAGDDSLTGSAGIDLLVGGVGGDSLDGGEGGDDLYGDFYSQSYEPGNWFEDGDDTLTGGTEDDRLYAGAGTDVYDGGAGFDMLSDMLGGGADTVVVTDTQVTVGAVTQDHGSEQISLFGGAGDDVLDGSAWTGFFLRLDGQSGDDSLIGGAIADVLAGGSGSDTLRGNGGNDSLTDDSYDGMPNSGGDDLMDGGEDDDNIQSGAGDDTLLGGAGNDVLSAGAGEDTYDAGEGTFDWLNDDLFDLTSPGGTMVLTDTEITLSRTGSSDPVTFTHNAERFEVAGSNGDDVMDASAFTIGQAQLYGGDGNDLLKAASGPSPFGTFQAQFLRGMGGNDTLIGGPQNDYLGGDDEGGFSLPGDDSIVGGGGDDFIVAGGGEDAYDGGEGNDQVTDELFAANSTGGTAVITDASITVTRTGSAPATFAHNAERLELSGSDGDDVIDAGALTVAQVALFGRAGNDRLVAGSWDSPFPDNTDNFLYGLDGNDTLIGGPQDDYLVAESIGDPTLTGDDSLAGGGGHDILISETGRDTLRGGDGPDVLSVGVGGGIADGGADDDSMIQYLTAEPDALDVSESTLTVNGAALALTSVGQLSIYDQGGIDRGTQTGPVSFTYTVSGLEPTIALDPAVNYPGRTLGGNSSFTDIGDAGQSWTATVDYGAGPEPLALDPVPGSPENRHTFAFNHTYTEAGTYPLTVTVTDAEGTTTTATTTVTVAPVVTQVRVRYGNGATRFVTLDDLAGRTLPWLNVSRFDVSFSDDVSVQSNDLRVTGPGRPGVAGFSYNAVDRRATWVFGRDFGRGSFTFNLDGDSAQGVADRLGNKLAGGAAGGTDFVRPLGFLPGDVTGDGAVTQLDVDTANAAVGGPYSPFADVNGDGLVDVRDVRAVQARVGTTLP